LKGCHKFAKLPAKTIFSRKRKRALRFDALIEKESFVQSYTQTQDEPTPPKQLNPLNLSYDGDHGL
jgi:hypothetical protein